MKKLILLAALIGFAASASAQTVTCSASGATTKQAAQYSAMLAKINAERVSRQLAPYANFNEHCADMMLSAFKSYIATQDSVDAAKAGAALTAHGDEVAPTGQCTVAGLGAGCLKSQVACWVLTGNTTCS
jgi:hypothetical protein